MQATAHPLHACFLAMRMAIVLLMLLLFAGCQRTPQRVALVPVEGTVVRQGQPVADALVMLHPRSDDAAIQKMSPRGRTDSAGKFTLKTYEDNDGAPAGEYAVTIDWTDERGVDRLGGKYADAATTELRVTISPTAPQLPPIVLP